MVNRGFLTGPVIPIYGLGATILIIALNPLAGNYPAVFLGGSIIASALEYFTSWGMEKLFHARWWDYSKHRFNLHGRIYLGASLFWGALSVFLFAILKPLSDQLITGIPRHAGEMAAAIIAILFSFDLITSIIAAAHLDQKLGELEAMRADFIQNLEKSRLYQAKSELHTSLAERISELRLSEITDRMRARIETYRTETQDTVGRIARKEELEALFRSFTEKYAKKLHPGFIHRRLLRAFPNFRPTRRGQTVLADIRERLSHRKGNNF